MFWQLSYEEVVGDANHFVLSKTRTLRGRQNFRELEVENIKETFKKDDESEFLTKHRDEKMLKESGDTEQTTHLAVLASHGNQSKLLGTTSVDRGTGLQQAEAIKEMLDDWEITEKYVATCFDATASNTGKFSGACILLEALRDRSLLWIACRRHVL